MAHHVFVLLASKVGTINVNCKRSASASADVWACSHSAVHCAYFSMLLNQQALNQQALNQQAQHNGLTTSLN